MNFNVNSTADGVKKYPLHKHEYYEIMLYLEGVGNLHTPNKDFPFYPGIIIIVPPGISHGSVSVNGFKNISISGDFSGVFRFREPMCICDNERREATCLVNMIYNNRFANTEFVSRLCQAYSQFIIQHMDHESNIVRCVDAICDEIVSRFSDPDFNLSDKLAGSGYAPDYIRSHFKKITGKTPVEYLTNTRIRHALFLIDIYADELSLQEVSENCGYNDYIYFSKRFKKIVGISPRDYKFSITRSKD